MRNILIIGGLIFLMLGCGFHRQIDGSFVLEKSIENYIYLINSSFEDHPRNAEKYKYVGLSGGFSIESHTPKGWMNCENPELVYILDSYKARYGSVSIRAANGYFYIGIVNKPNKPKGILAQNLSEPLLSGTKYSFSMNVAFAPIYLDMWDIMEKNPLKDVPGNLQIWGSNDGCEREQLLFTSNIVDNLEWENLKIDLEPTSNYNYLLLELNTQINDESNILIDDISKIEKLK